MSSEVNISDPAVRAELDKLNKLDGGVPFRASTQHAHHTWARTFHSSPELYIQPESLAEVEKAITLARRCRKRITTVGCGHSPSDMTCTSSWMMNLDKFNKILDVNKEKNLVTMQAGIRLYQLGAELDKLGLAMPNLGSINDQSIAGAISTGTHGSTLRHSILSSSVTSLKITLANSRTLHCTPDENEELFRAALCSLGALGVITEITFQAVSAFTLHWSQTVYPDSHMLDNWNKDLWTQAEFVRVWWFPYTRRSTVWKAFKTDETPEKMPYKPSYYDTKFGYTIYHNLLYVAHYVPRILPWVEWFVFGMQYGFSTGPKTTQEAIQPSREALLMNCLYSQYVNEWALPLKNGPEALRRLSSWLNHLKPTDKDYVEHGIPFSAKGLWVHAPIEVRVSDTTVALKNQDGTPRKSARPYLDSTCNDGPTLYLNATLYRPYNMDPPCRITYYQGFEYLMRELGGKPHWAKNFEVTGEQIAEMYGDDLQAFRKVRDEADPEGLFTGPWHRRYLLSAGKPRLELEEVESTRKPLPTGGVEVFGSLPVETKITDDADYVKKPVFDEVKKVEEVKKEAAAAKVAVSKALQDSEDLRMRLKKKVEEKLARESADKAEKQRLGKIADEKAAAEIKAEAARVQAIEDECVRKAKLQKIAGDKKAEDARLKKIEDDKKEQARLQRIEDDKIAAEAAAEKSRIQKEEEDRAAADAAAFAEAQEQERIQQAAVEKQRRTSWEAHEKERIRLLKEKDEIAAKQARKVELKQQREAQAEAAKNAELKLKQEQEAQVAKDTEELRLRKESEARKLEVKREAEERELKMQQEREEAARVQAAKDQELRMKREAEAKELELKEQQEAQAAKAAEKLRLKQEAQAAKAAEELRLKQESEAKAAREAQELKLKQEREEAARVEAAKQAEALRLKQQAEAIKAQVEEQKKKDELAAAELKKQQDAEAAAARAESERLKKIKEDRIAAEQEAERIADEKARLQREKEAKEESDRLAAIEAQKRKEESERLAAIKAKKDEEERLAAVAKKEEDDRLEREANAKRQEEERIRLERQEANRKRLAEEKAQKERELAERRRIAEEERLAAVEKKKRDDEHNAKLAAEEAQRLKEEAAERHAQRQQQLKEAQEAREREEYEKRMVAEHNRREAAKAEAILRERDEKDRIARVEHDNQVRLEKGRLAREAKEREDRLERERLAEDARQIQKRHEVEEKRKRIQEKKEAQRIEIQRKQAERREAAAAKKAIEDEAAKKAQEERAVQQKAEADEKTKKAKEIREAFKAQIAARAAQAAAEAEKQKQSRPETPASSKGRRSLSPKTNGASSRPATPAAKANSPAKAEDHKPATFADAVKEDLPSGETKSPKANSENKTPNTPKAPTSPKAQRTFRPTMGTPTPSVLLAKREGLEPAAGSPAQKRIKLEELKEETPVVVKKEETAWKPQARPNSLDELLAEQEREMEEEEKN